MDFSLWSIAPSPITSWQSAFDAHFLLQAQPSLSENHSLCTMGLSQHTPDSGAIFPLFAVSLKAGAEDEPPSQQCRLVKWIPAERGLVGGGENTLFLGISVSEFVISGRSSATLLFPAPHQSRGFSLSLHPCLECTGRANEAEVFPVFSLVIVHGRAVVFCCASVLQLWGAAPGW